MALVALPPGGMRKHFCLRLPMKSCRPMRAKTLRQNTVRIITSESFFTDWISAPTMVFKPERETEGEGARGHYGMIIVVLIIARIFYGKETADKSLQ